MGLGSRVRGSEFRFQEVVTYDLVGFTTTGGVSTAYQDINLKEYPLEPDSLPALAPKHLILWDLGFSAAILGTQSDVNFDQGPSYFRKGFGSKMYSTTK